MKSFIVHSYIILLLLIQTFLAVIASDKNLKVELNLRGLMPTQTACNSHTVVFSNDTLAITLFVDQQNTRDIKDIVPLVVGSIAQNLVYRGGGKNPYKTPCSQMYYLLSNLLTYELLFVNNLLPSDINIALTDRFNEGYQDASDIAFVGFSQPEIDANNALNEKAFEKLVATDYINLYNGKLSSSGFFSKMRSALSQITQDQGVKAAFEDAFHMEEVAFGLASNYILKFIQLLNAKIQFSSTS